jgi:hypothetical protein
MSQVTTATPYMPSSILLPRDSFFHDAYKTMVFRAEGEGVPVTKSLTQSTYTLCSPPSFSKSRRCLAPTAPSLQNPKYYKQISSTLPARLSESIRIERADCQATITMLAFLVLHRSGLST